MALRGSFLISYRSGQKGYDFSYRITGLNEEESFSFVKIDFHYIMGRNCESISRETCGPLVAGADGVGFEEMMPKYSWTMRLSRDRLFYDLCCLFVSCNLRKFGVPDDVSSRLIPDIFDFARANKRKTTQILVSIDVCTLQYEGETQEDVSARMITSGTFSRHFCKPEHLFYIADLVLKRYEWLFHYGLDVEECSICLEGNVPGKMSTGIRLRCSHIYHARCMLGWFVWSRTCPLCRSPLFSSVFSCGTVEQVIRI